MIIKGEITHYFYSGQKVVLYISTEDGFETAALSKEVFEEYAAPNGVADKPYVVIDTEKGTIQEMG